MPRLKSKLFLPSLIVFSVLLSGCQFADQLKETVSTGIFKQAPKAWKQQGNRYSITVDYETPGGLEANNFHLTVDKGVITAVEVEVLTDIKASIRYQNDFANALKPVLVGKKISEIGTIDKLSGATLTTDAFNQALAKLKAEI